MKYITQDWTSTKDGYLFFVQRLQEMLFHYSDDIVKAPVHNTQTLLEEYVDTEKDVVKGSIKQYQLDIIAKEIKSSLMTDVIVRELYKYEVIEEMAKFLDKDQRTAVHYIFNKIPKKKYYEICCKYLKENLSESNRKTEIEKGLRAWLAFLLWHGYSSEYIYRFLRNIFEESINDPEKKAQIFLNRFDFEIGKYKVYFVFYEKLKPYQKLLNERLHISFEDDGCFKQIKRKQKSFIGVMETKAYDNYSAMKRAYSALEIFLRYLEVFLNDNISVIGKNGLVIRQDTQEGIILPVKAFGYKSIKPEPRENFKTEILDSKEPILVDFFATWCGPCNMLSPILENISNTRADFNIAKVNIDELRDLAIDYEVEVVPTLLIFKNGKVVGRIEGLVSEEEIVNKVQECK